MKNRKCATIAAGLLPLMLLAGRGAGAEAGGASAVQVDLGQFLNARVVITQKEGQLQWADHALDSGNSILITQGAAKVAEAGGLVPLPDSGRVAANERHPEVKLNYADGEGGPQVCRMAARTATNSIPVPAGHYRQMQAFFISANGPTPISATLHYAGGTVQKERTVVPDFFFLPKPADKGWFVLVEGFGKVDRKGKMTEVDHHYIHGFDLNPEAGKVLQSVEIAKEDSRSVLNLFGLTGSR